MFDRFRRNRDSTVTNDTTATPRANTNDPNAVREKHASRSPKPDLEAQTGGDVDGWADPYGPPPGFKGWFKLYWHDLLAFVFLGAIALWLLKWSPVPYKKYFAVSYDPSDAGSPFTNVEYAHPKVKQFVPIIPDAMIAVFTPIVTIVIVNLFGIATYHPPGARTPKARRRGSFFMLRGSFWNVNNGCMGVIYSVMTGATIQIIIKLVVPGMRPHFLTVCDPQIGSDTRGSGYRGMYFTTDICRDHSDKKRQGEIANALQSFPSGHSVAVWAGLLYLSLYLNAHLKIFSNYHPSYWKLLVFVAPLVAAVLIVGSLSMDMSHNWYDIVVGSLIGVAMAILSYRMCFASVWDFRWNHVPLKRGANRGREEVMGFGYTGDEMVDWCGGCATRRAGWGVARGNVVGAPGDSSAFFVSGFSPAMREGFGSHGHGHHSQNGPTHYAHGTTTTGYPNEHAVAGNGITLSDAGMTHPVAETSAPGRAVRV